MLGTLVCAGVPGMLRGCDVSARAGSPFADDARYPRGSAMFSFRSALA